MSDNEWTRKVVELEADNKRLREALERIADGQDGTGDRMHGTGYPDGVQRLARRALKEANDVE